MSRPAPSPGRRRRCLVASVLAVAVVSSASVPGAAQASRPAVPTATPADAVARISGSLDDVAVTGGRAPLLVARLEAAVQARDQAAAALVRLRGEERRLAAASALAGARERLASIRAEGWSRRVEVLAVEAYIGAGDDASVLDAGLDPSFTRGEQRALLSTEVDGRWRAELVRARREAVAARTERRRLDDEHETVRAEQERTEATRVEAAATARRLRPMVRDARATATVVGSDLTLVALDAYLRAALDTSREPGCLVPWWLLAGIGRVESGHGTFAGSLLDPAGTARPGIVGIALDGTNGTAVITDTDGGALDGDPVSDRAVGPMQFIPSTWAAHGADGNGDGVLDPQNIYDAARSAARYLCAAAGPLDGDDALRRGLFAYNRSQAYVDKVLSYAQEYRAWRA